MATRAVQEAFASVRAESRELTRTKSSRLPLDPAAVAQCLLGPGLLYAWVYRLGSGSLRFYDWPVAAALGPAAGLVACCAATAWARGRLRAVKPARGPVALAVCLWVALVLGCVQGDENFHWYVSNMYNYQDAATYTDIAPSTDRGQSYMDAGQVYFQEGAHVATEEMAAFKSANLYCVAPIVGEPLRNQVENAQPSFAWGSGGAAPAPEPEKQAPPPTSANASAKEDQAGKMKDAVKESSSSIASLLSGKKIEDALKGVTGGKVVDAITKADPSKIEDAARHVAEGGQKIAEAAKDASVKDIASAVTSEVGGSTGSVVDQAKSALDRTGMTDPDSALDKAKQVLDKAKEAKDVSLGDLAGKAKSTSVADLKDAAAAAKNPKEFLDNIGKTKAVKPVGGGGEDKGSEEGGSSGFAVVFLILLAVGGYVLFTRLTQPRQVGRPMLSDDYGAEGTAMTTGHWMGASARDMMGTSGAAEFNRF
mmetsp:Transcript_79060/g.224060  ORF Transcript_79060/g.224060 Transcript_79060/m.224060 type:complete len:480 (+) Transcript_79060:101-1540(+)